MARIWSEPEMAFAEKVGVVEGMTFQRVFYVAAGMSVEMPLGAVLD